MTTNRGQTPIWELLKIGIPSMFISNEKLFWVARIFPLWQCALYSSPSLMSVMLGEDELSLSWNLTWRISQIPLPHMGEMESKITSAHFNLPFTQYNIMSSGIMKQCLLNIEQSTNWCVVVQGLQYSEKGHLFFFVFILHLDLYFSK